MKMGRPEPCVLFAQTILHSSLDEYVDEVLFSEPVVITACEILEQNASPSTPNISLIGATSPPSFALEVFVHCEGESRFRRLCQPFLYSHSSSNALEVEAIVTSHLVLRGTFRSLTLVVYGNTAEDLGQFNIELDLDSSLANVVNSPSEGKLEDLPPLMHLPDISFDKFLSSPKCLIFHPTDLDLPPKMKSFLLLCLKICQSLDNEDRCSDVTNIILSTASNYSTASSDDVLGNQEELLKIWKNIQPQDVSHMGISDEFLLGSEEQLPRTEDLVAMFKDCFSLLGIDIQRDLTSLSQDRVLALALSLSLFLCSSRESCSHFVKASGMVPVLKLTRRELHESAPIMLLLLGIIECATRHGIGCEAFLEWWPREDEKIPSRKSDGYCFLLKVLLEKQRHDIASLSTSCLQRLRFYELVCRFESAVTFCINNLSSEGPLTTKGQASLRSANDQLVQILRLLTLCSPIEDQSPVAFAQRACRLCDTDRLLSYKATINFIHESKYSFMRYEIDPYLLSLMQERGFLPLSAALLSCPTLRSAYGSTAEIFLEVALSIESILLSLLFCRSGLTFLIAQPEAVELIILSLQEVVDMNKTDCMTLRQAAILLSKGFFCHPDEIGTIVELHIKVASTVDRLLAATPNTDDQLWVLWELCAISRSDSGRQALLALGHFPEALSILLDALRSYKDVGSNISNSVGSSIGLAIFHSASEIFEVLVVDSTASSLRSWIGLAVDLHKVLHSSSPGSNRKDAPTRLLEWIDAGVVFQRNGAIGLLRYAAILASGGDAHLSSASVLVSDTIDVENVVADSSSSEGQFVDSLLGKLISDKTFDGITLQSTVLVQLTTAFRILAFISDDSAVAARLYEEGAVSVLYIVLVNCKIMLERLSTSYDYLVDEGAESSSTTDLLLDCKHEQMVVDLMIPSLLLLINLLHKLHDAKEMYRNKKLLNALFHLHREVSPTVAACAADLSFLYPGNALGFGCVCHLITSALACWPIFGWAPGLFHCILENVQATTTSPALGGIFHGLVDNIQATSTSLALGPKDACSLLCLLGDLLPEEGIWLWKNEIPPSSAIRNLSTGTVLGLETEREIGWYLRPENIAVLLVRMMPQLDRLALIVENFATSALAVIQDMLRIFIVRMASQNIECAIPLLRPIFSSLNSKVGDANLSSMDAFKVLQLLSFISGLAEHPNSKALLCKMGTIQTFSEVLQRCSDVVYLEDKQDPENREHSINNILLRWMVPTLKSLALIFDSQSYLEQVCLNDNIGIEESSLIICHLLRLFQVLPAGKELLACALTFKELVSSKSGRCALSNLFSRSKSYTEEEQKQDFSDAVDKSSNEYDWTQSRTLLTCWKKLLKSVETDELTGYWIETLYALSVGALCIVLDDSSNGLLTLKGLFGLSGTDDTSQMLTEIVSLIENFEDRIVNADHSKTNVGQCTINEVLVSLRSLSHLLQSVSTESNSEDVACSPALETPGSIIRSVVMTSYLIPSLSALVVNDEATLFFWNAWKEIGEEAAADETSDGALREKFLWELPDSSIARQIASSQSARKKNILGDSSVRRSRDNQISESSVGLSRGSNMPTNSLGSTRRDSFRQRKPNTSRPPSMHVDDYVARERNIDGGGVGSNIINSTQRGGSSSGRPPSIHVDEFEARQRERQNSMLVMGGNAQVKSMALPSHNEQDKQTNVQKASADIDDDQEIDIVFDEESGSDDKLPFPQPDDNLQPPVIIGENSPFPAVEENRGDQNEKSRFRRVDKPSAMESNYEIRGSDPALKMPAEKDVHVPPERSPFVLFRENASPHDHSEQSRYSSIGSKGSNPQSTTSIGGFPTPPLHAGSALHPDHSLRRPNTYGRNSTKIDSSLSAGTQAHGDRIPSNQPPLPPMPPPFSSSSSYADLVRNRGSHAGTALRDAPAPPLPSALSRQPFDATPANTNFGLQLQTENYSGNSSARPIQPPLPTQQANLSAVNSASAALYSHSGGVGNQSSFPAPLVGDSNFGITATSASITSPYPVAPFAPSLPTNRPSTFHGSLLNTSSSQNSLFTSNLPQIFSSSFTSVSSMLPRPPLPPPPSHISLQAQLSRQPAPSNAPQVPSDQGKSVQHSSFQVQMPLQFAQPLPITQLQLYYQSQHQEHLQPVNPLAEQGSSHTQSLHVDSSIQQQNELEEMSLQQFISSPEAIQSLLSDRDKLLQLLDKYPKLLQMLEERLGQL